MLSKSLDCASQATIHARILPPLVEQELMEELESLVGREHMDRPLSMSFTSHKAMFRQGTFKCSGLAQCDLSAAKVMEDGLCGCLDLDLEQVCHESS